MMDIVVFPPRYYLSEVLNKTDESRTHIFDSFFYTRLTQMQSNDVDSLPYVDY